MVKRALLLIWMAIVPLSMLAGPAKEYYLGDKLEEDLIAPVQVDIIDSEATDVLREREAHRVPVVYRFYPHAASEVEAAFHSSFLATHVSFLDAIEAEYHKRKLNPEEISSSQFQQFVASFQKQNILAPVGTNLAAIWAGAESDQKFESAMISQLREAMKAYIRSDVSPEDVWVGSTLRLVSLGDNEVTTAQLAEDRGTNIGKTNFTSLPRAKSELQNRFAQDQRDLGKYVASFIKPNCLMEADLTREMRSKRTETILAAYHFDPGQVIAKRGQFVDKKIKAALDQISAKSGGSRPTVTTAPVAATAPLKVSAGADREWAPWLVTMSAVFFVFLILILTVVWNVARRQTQTMLLTPAPEPAMLSAPALDPNLSDEEVWQQRALLAERNARRAQAAARNGFIAQLARWFSDKMTQKLIAQRSELLDAHQKAAMEMAELEARLVKVHAPLQERLQAYQRRIVELEKELLIKGEENRELIKAKIQIVRKQMEIEREKNRLEYN
jgi:membrane-associated HD superfamily phosphohydrolase